MQPTQSMSGLPYHEGWPILVSGMVTGHQKESSKLRIIAANIAQQRLQEALGRARAHASFRGQSGPVGKGQHVLRVRGSVFQPPITDLP